MAIPGSGFPDSAKGRFSQASDPSLTYLFRGVNSHYSDIQWGDWQPRVGIAYQVTPKTVVRAGAGVFSPRRGVGDSVFLGGNPPFQPTASISFGNVDNPGAALSSTAAPPLTVTTQSKAFKNPEAWNWNLMVERETFLKSVVSVGYVGRRGLHLQRESNINQPTPDVVAANPGVNLDALRPYKGYNSIRETDNVASSTYTSLQVQWNRRFAQGVLFGVSYTLSKSMDDGSAQRDIIPDTYFAHNLWGQSDFDVRHVFIANFLYELPFLRAQHNLAGKIMGGWQVSGIFQAQTGTTCGVAVSNDYVGVGQDGSMSCAGQFWAINGSPEILHNMAYNGGGKNDPALWFSTTNSDGSAIFTQPAKGTFVHQNGIRNPLHNPGFNNWNLGLYKKFAIRENMALQFRAEAFDAFNHPNWGGANYNPTSGTFGQITGKTGDVRNLQLSLRFQF